MHEIYTNTITNSYLGDTSDATISGSNLLTNN